MNTKARQNIRSTTLLQRRIFGKFVRRSHLIIILTFAFVPSISISAPSQLIGDSAGKVVWVDFWASWCAPCRRSFPWMNAMQRKYSSQGLKIIAINVDAERSSADEFLKQTPALFSLRFDPDGELAREFDVQAMPSSFLLDESGRILEQHLGFKQANAERYETGIKKALEATRARHASQ